MAFSRHVPQVCLVAFYICTFTKSVAARRAVPLLPARNDPLGDSNIKTSFQSQDLPGGLAQNKGPQKNLTLEGVNKTTSSHLESGAKETRTSDAGPSPSTKDEPAGHTDSPDFTLISSSVGKFGHGRPTRTPEEKAAAAAKEAASGNKDWILPRGHEPRVGQMWLKAHAAMVAEVKAMDSGSKGLDVLFLGDSAVESLRGTFLGSSWTDFSHIAALFKDLFPKYSTRALGLAGDSIGTLLWRLKNGEFPRLNKPRLVVLMTGTSDLSGERCLHADTAATSAARLIQVIQYINTEAPDAHVAVIGVLPKGEMWPNICTKPIEETNLLVRDYVATNPKTRYVDVESEFVDQTQMELIERLIPDALNPSDQAWHLLARFYLDPIFDEVLDGHYPSQASSTT
eukprot:jgi/Botrbrau1/11664/Bobra.168_2s0019.1